MVSEVPSKSPASNISPLEDCEETVMQKCGIDQIYGKLMSCVAKTVRRSSECEEAVALGGGNGIGHILSDDTMYWIEYRGNHRKLMPAQDDAESSCGETAFSLCGDSCAIAGTNEEIVWFTCLDITIYDESHVQCSGDQADVDAWDYIAWMCGFYDKLV